MFKVNGGPVQYRLVSNSIAGHQARDPFFAPSKRLARDTVILKSLQAPKVVSAAANRIGQVGRAASGTNAPAPAKPATA